ncbi:MAG TPA: hypothetical protein DCZ95_17585 [Verrucomicrobia bacterium]|nr:MAG: hypothetical protein A2X46_17655 [Lentisphaerae bacterium GWF2_57_35]HBA85899.1 hypothetical protein [Verrucomicrobiota bacterium]
MSEPCSFGRDGARPSKIQFFVKLQLFAAIISARPSNESILEKQQVARLLPARNASRSDAQAGEDGLFGS